MSEWQPIDENTPRDGTPILMCVLDEYGYEVFSATYEPLYAGHEFPWLTTTVSGRFGEHIIKHWMPLPSAPKDGQ